VIVTYRANYIEVTTLDSHIPLSYNSAVFTGIYLTKPRFLHLLWISSILLIVLSSCDLLGGDKLTISWSTESELDIIGFNLLRSESADGPFMRINEELIPPAEDPNVGGEHSYIDRDVSSGVTYFYRLETVDRQGNVTQSEPIVITAGS
jgi:hypothetical protein